MHNTPSMSSNAVDTRDNGDQQLQESIDSSLHRTAIYRIFTEQVWLVRYDYQDHCMEVPVFGSMSNQQECDTDKS
jgi:hypothetical protein